MKLSANKIAQAIAAPLSRHPLTFIFFFVASLPVCLVFTKENLSEIWRYLAVSSFISWCLTAITALMQWRILRMAYVMTITLMLIMMDFLDIYCISIFNSEMNQDYIGIVMETNPNETIEYISLIRRHLIYAGVCVFAISAIAATFYRTRSLRHAINIRLQNIITRNTAKVSIFITISGIIAATALPISEKHPLRRARFFFNGNNYPDLRRHYTEAIITESSVEHPDIIVLIIGESLSRSHCSLFGYPHPTQPRLEHMLDSGRIFTFDNVTSKATSTVRSLRYVLSTYRGEVNTNWWECMSINEFFKKAGYRTFWLSNQAKSGLHDNFASLYANLCDYTRFSSEIADGPQFDGILVDMSQHVLADSADKKAIIYHIMGQHPNFRNRFPKESEYFSLDDYKDIPEHQRENYCQYDNSIRYNDSIVASIISLYSSRNSAIIYFPDHGLDFYESEPDFCRHAKNNAASIAAAIKIPMMIVLGDSLLHTRPHLAERLQAARNKEWCTSEAVYTIMDIAGYKFAGNNDVEQYSLFGAIE